LKLLYILSLLSISAITLAEIPLHATEKMTAVGLALINNTELRRSQKFELEKTVVEVKKRTEEAHKTIQKNLAHISNELQEAHQSLAHATDTKRELLSKKIAILNDRKQSQIDQQDTWRELVETHEQRVKIYDELLECLNKPPASVKNAYSWKEFRDAHIKFAEQQDKIELNKIKKDNLKKQRIALNELLTSLNQQYSVKTKENDRISAQVDRNADHEKNANPEALRQEADNIAQELLAIEESIKAAKLQIDKIDTEIRLWEDIIDLEQQRSNSKKALLGQIEQRLVLDKSDVEIARTDWKTEAQSALIIKEKINALREPKKQNKEKVSSELDFLREKLSTLKDTTVNGKESLESILIKAQIRRLTALLQAIEKELKLLDAKKDLADMAATERELQYHMVEMRYRLKLETENLDEPHSAFSNKRDLAFSALRGLKDARTQAISHLIEVNRSLERIKSYQKQLQVDHFIASGQQAINPRDLLSIMQETNNYLTWQLDFTQSYLAVNADLLTNQEKIINQYDLILYDIEHRRRNNNIWIRSPKAISYDAFIAAILEGEAFLKTLYWETPAHIRPSSLVNLIRSFDLYDFFMLLCFCALFCALFLLLKKGLLIARNKLSKTTERLKGHTRYLYFHLILAFFDFTLAYFSLFFTWLFIFLHIACDFSYIFSTLRPLASPYSVAVFHLTSIPLLIFLTRKFIGFLRDVNEKLSYLLFAEKFQARFIVLVSIFCYTSATLVPLRLALISYTDTRTSAFSILILAAYSLITVLIVTFLFSKDDILRLIPTTNSMLILLKRKIDKHYYPVFFFAISLFVLSNPYIGYSSMAWFLAGAVPGSLFIAYFLFSIHHVIRRYAVFMFMKEDEDDFIDKFEHAKAYYGFFVIFSFLVLLFITFTLVSRIWHFNYSPTDIWHALSKEWVVPISVDHSIGVIQFLVIGLFIAAGFIVSSITHRFILTKLFDILRSEPGIQNTISRICHYTIIFIAIILAMINIQLQQFMLYVGASFGIALGFALKDIGADLLSGIFVLIERPLEIGNYVEIDTIKGTVHRIAARSTTIITSKNHSVIIPNRDLVSKWIINWGHGRYAIGFELNVRIDPSVDPDLVKKVIFSVVQANPLVLKVPGVVGRLEEFEENAFVFLIRAFISARRVKEQWEIAAAIRTELIRAFKEHGIKLARAERIIVFDQQGQQPATKAIEIKFDR